MSREMFDADVIAMIRKGAVSVGELHDATRKCRPRLAQWERNLQWDSNEWRERNSTLFGRPTWVSSLMKDKGRSPRMTHTFLLPLEWWKLETCLALFFMPFLSCNSLPLYSEKSCKTNHFSLYVYYSICNNVIYLIFFSNRPHSWMIVNGCATAMSSHWWGSLKPPAVVHTSWTIVLSLSLIIILACEHEPPRDDHIDDENHFQLHEI